VTDSTSNLPLSLAAERRVHIAPLYILWGDDCLKDGIEISEEELFQRMVSSDVMPKTSQVTPHDFISLFRTLRDQEQADEIVCAVLSADLSGTYASAMQAKESVDLPVHVIDTRQASWTHGFAALAGADARDAGADAQGIVHAIKTAAQNSVIVFTVETLDYLHRGGRIGRASWLLGTALNIKPVLEVQQGVVSATDKVRTRKRAIEHMVTIAEKRAAGRRVKRVGIVHGNVESEAQTLLARAVATFAPQESYLHFATSAIGVHIGPGALGVGIQWDN
jgi:DegV family protein with EDD domain